MTQGKKILWVTGALGFLWVSVLGGARVNAAGIVPGSRFDQGSQMCRVLTFPNSSWTSKGAAFFRQTCKSCHQRGNDKGARFLHSESFTSKGWDRVFFEKYPKCAQDGSWSGLDAEQLRQVNDYLYRNAFGTYDANSAESCG